MIDGDPQAKPASPADDAFVEEMQRVQEQLLRAAWAASHGLTIRAASRNRREDPPPAG